MFGTLESVLIKEAFLFPPVPIAEVPLYMYMYTTNPFLFQISHFFSPILFYSFIFFYLHFFLTGTRGSVFTGSVLYNQAMIIT